LASGLRLRRGHRGCRAVLRGEVDRGREHPLTRQRGLAGFVVVFRGIAVRLVDRRLVIDLPNRSRVGPRTGRLLRPAAAPLLIHLGGSRDARQQVLGLLADDHLAAGRQEPDDQANLPGRAAHLVPGDPDAVGMTDVRLAVVLGELFLGEDVLPVGLDVVGGPARLIKRVNCQDAIDLDRYVAHRVIEHQTPAEAPRWGPARLAQDGIGPYGNDPGRHLGVLNVAQRPRDVLGEVEIGAARRRHDQGGC
jgi:hypothetical protein